MSRPARPDVWQDDVPQPYRVLFGDVYAIDGRNIDHISVQPAAIRFCGESPCVASFASTVDHYRDLRLYNQNQKGDQLCVSLPTPQYLRLQFLHLYLRAH
jgi:hypothetical protein